MAHDFLTKDPAVLCDLNSSLQLIFTQLGVISNPNCSILHIYEQKEGHVDIDSVKISSPWLFTQHFKISLAKHGNNIHNPPNLKTAWASMFQDPQNFNDLWKSHNISSCVPSKHKHYFHISFFC